MLLLYYVLLMVNYLRAGRPWCDAGCVMPGSHVLGIMISSQLKIIVLVSGQPTYCLPSQPHISSIVISPQHQTITEDLYSLISDFNEEPLCWF